MIEDKEVYVVDCLRTPIGKFGGTLSTVRPDDLATHVIKRLVERNTDFDFNELEDVIFGATNQAGEDNRDVARMALLMAGLSHTIGGVTVNRLCASGLQAIVDASRAIKAGDGEAYIAGGVESMSRGPYVLSKAGNAFSRTQEMFDTSLGWRFENPVLTKMGHTMSNGITAENVAEKWNISREAQDAFAYQSQLNYQQAHEADRFKEELEAVSIPQRKKDPVVFGKDEHPRLSEPEVLAKLRPAFKEGGSVTAGNASGINDGAAAMLIVSGKMVKQYNLRPMARVVSHAIAGVEPAYMGIGPVPATQKALKRAGLTANEIGLVELNEAFASQSVACVQDLEFDPMIVNVNGGAIALGHPLGCSGTRIATTLLHEMKKREDVTYGVATMCVGVGQGAAVIFERV